MPKKKSRRNNIRKNKSKINKSRRNKSTRNMSRINKSRRNKITRNKSRRNKSRNQNARGEGAGGLCELDKDIMIERILRSGLPCNEIYKLRGVNSKCKEMIDENIGDIFQMVVRESHNKDDIKYITDQGKELNAEVFKEWCVDDMTERRERRERERDAEEYNNKYSCHECMTTMGKPNYEEFGYQHPDTPVVLCDECYKNTDDDTKQAWGLN